MPIAPRAPVIIGVIDIRGRGTTRRAPLSLIAHRKPFELNSDSPVIHLQPDKLTLSFGSMIVQNRKVQGSVRSRKGAAVPNRVMAGFSSILPTPSRNASPHRAVYGVSGLWSGNESRCGTNSCNIMQHRKFNVTYYQCIQLDNGTKHKLKSMSVSYTKVVL
jgi:hypothetical protein